MIFAAEFGRSVNRWDFWTLRKEHTPFQWMLQAAIYRVAPYGTARDDMRGAVLSANIMRMHAAGEITDDEFRQTVDNLQDYLPGIDAYEDKADMDALAEIKRLNQKVA